MQRGVVLGKQDKGLYCMNKDFQRCQFKENCVKIDLKQTNKAFENVTARFSIFELWHIRLGHLSFEQLKHIGVSDCNNFRHHGVCQICPMAKMHRNSFSLSNTRATTCFELLHVDIWGPYLHHTYNGSQYFHTIVDDQSREAWVHLMGCKSNALPLLKSFVLFVEKQFGRWYGI